MKSGLEGRNNRLIEQRLAATLVVSMKSGLEGRNNNPDMDKDEYKRLSQ